MLWIIVMFLSDSHSDGTHSLQRHISTNLMKKQTHSDLIWPKHIFIFVIVFHHVTWFVPSQITQKIHQKPNKHRRSVRRTPASKEEASRSGSLSIILIHGYLYTRKKRNTKIKHFEIIISLFIKQ